MQIFFQQATTNSPLLALISLLHLFVHFTSLSPVVLAPSSYLHTFFPLFLKQVWLEKHLQILYYKAFQSSSNQNAQYFSVFSELILVLEVFTDWGWGEWNICWTTKSEGWKNLRSSLISIVPPRRYSLCDIVINYPEAAQASGLPRIVNSLPLTDPVSTLFSQIKR